MNPRRIVRKIDLANCDQCVERLGSLMFTGDANGHRIELTIEDGGQAADLTGMSARGYFYHVIGGQVNEFAVNGTITGNMAAVTFPPEAYPKGQNKVVFKVEKTGVSIPVYAAMYHVQDADADTVTDPTDTIESLPELLAQIEAMKAATAAANTAAATANQAAQNANDTAAALGVIDDTAVNTINPWSSKNIVDRLCLPMTAEGNPVTLDHPVEGYPLDITAHIEPYQEGSGDPSPENVRPIVVPETLELRRTGKNLIALETELLTSVNKGGIAPIILPSGYYILSVRNRDGSTTGIMPGSTFSVRLNYKNGNNRYINSYPNGFYVTEDESKKIITISIAYSNTYYTGTSDVIRFQLERGTTITPYEPYRGDTYSVALPAGFAGGDVGNDGSVEGTWHKMIITGTEGLDQVAYELVPTSSSGIGEEIVRASIPGVALNSVPGDNSVCNYYGYRAEFPRLRSSQTVPRLWIEYQKSQMPSTNDLKTHFKTLFDAGDPVELWYRLATPTNQTISPQVIPALPGENVITSNAQSLTVKARADTPHLMGKVLDRLAAVEAQTTNI